MHPAPSKRATQPPQRAGLRYAKAFAYAYGGLLLGLLCVRYGAGDRTWWSFAINSLLLYAFVPAPIAVVGAVLYRDRLIAAIAGLSFAVFAWHWGGLFLPATHASGTASQSIRVMTYNTLGYNIDTAGTIRVVREVNADIVALQELAPEHATALEQTFSEKYPYRLMDARPGVTGCGILSRYPLRKIDAGVLDTLPWIGDPMPVEIEIHGQRVTFVNFHTYAGPAHTNIREKQARALVEFAKVHPGPLIFAGDLNATDQNEAHAIITRTLHDAWRTAGWGFGHTFPGKPTPDVGGSRPVILGIPVPMWLVRIDHIFHSDVFVALDAHLGPDDAGSDHRPVVTTLAWVIPSHP